MQTREALTNALLDYEGSVLLVSHDRHLLRQTVDEFWLVNQGAVLPFHGDLEDYKQWFFQQQTKRTNRPEGTKTYTTNISKTACSPTLSRREQRRLAAEKRQKAALLRRPIEKEIKRIEKLLDSKQSEHQSLLKTISDNKFYTPAYDKKRESILAKEGVLAKEIEALEEQWLAQQEKIEKINHSTQPP